MFLQPAGCLARLETLTGSFNDHVAEDNIVDQVFDVSHRLFRERSLKFIREAAAVHRKNFDEMNLFR